MTDKEKRKEQILMKAHELAKSAKPLVDNMPLSTIIAATIEMAEWCDANPVKEPVSEDLEEAAEKYADKHPTCGLAKQSFKAGALWQKEQMMTKAVDATIEEPEPLLWRVLGELEGLFVIENKLHDGDGVKVIIVREG